MLNDSDAANMAVTDWEVNGQLFLCHFDLPLLFGRLREPCERRDLESTPVFKTDDHGAVGRRS